MKLQIALFSLMLTQLSLKAQSFDASSKTTSIVLTERPDSVSNHSASSGNCSVDDLFVLIESSICPGEETAVNTWWAQTPEGGGLAIEFRNVDSDEIINLIGVEFPYFFDNDLNGVLSFNGVDPFVGEYELTVFAYADPDNVQATTCSISDFPATIFFLGENDAECIGPACLLEAIYYDGPQTICPGESTSFEVGSETVIPSNGGLGFRLFDVETDEEIITITNITSPYVFDNDLNGELSTNGYDLLVGQYIFTAFTYMDANDPIGSECDAAFPRNYFFLDENTPPCNCAVSSLELAGPENICPDESSTVNLPIDPDIPDGGGVAVKFVDVANEVFVYLIDFTFPFTFTNDLNGILSEPFTGECEISAFVYLDEANPYGSLCVESAEPISVFFLDANDADCQDPELCEAGIISAPEGTGVCPGEVIAVENEGGYYRPVSGGYRYKITTAQNTYYSPSINPQISFYINNNLGGLVSGAGDPPLIGDASIIAQVYLDSSDPNNSICAESNALSLTFYENDDSFCVNSISELDDNNNWNLFPNPAQTHVSINIKTSYSEPVSVSIYDMMGKLVLEQNNISISSQNASIQLNIAALTKGMYQVKVESEGFNSTKLLVITQ